MGKVLRLLLLFGLVPGPIRLTMLVRGHTYNMNDVLLYIVIFLFATGERLLEAFNFHLV